MSPEGGHLVGTLLCLMVGGQNLTAGLGVRSAIYRQWSECRVGSVLLGWVDLRSELYG